MKRNLKLLYLVILFVIPTAVQSADNSTSEMAASALNSISASRDTLQSNCVGVSNTQVALPGVGCYATTIPANQTSVTYWPAVDNVATNSPATPKITSNYPGPLQTNDWWSSLIWNWNEGAASVPPSEPFSQIMHAHPFSMQAEHNGLRMSYTQEIVAGTNTAGTGALTGYANYIFPGVGAEHLRVTVDGMNASETLVDDYSDWTVTAFWEDGADSMSATFGHGLPYVFFEKTGGDFTIKLVGAASSVVNDGEVFAFTATNNFGTRYGLFAPSGSTWTQNGLNIELNAPAGANYLAVAALPDNSASTLELFRKHAYNFVTDTQVDYSVNTSNQRVTTTFTTTTNAKESGGNLLSGPLVALYRHQWLNLADTLTDTGLSYMTSRGEMKLYQGADSFTTEMTFGGVLPSLPDVAIENLDGYTDAQLKTYITDLYDANDDYSSSSDPQQTYWEGKNLNKIAQLVHLADQQGLTTQRDSFISFIQETLEDWFDGEYPHVFYLDTNWDVLQGYPASFGSDSQINDHNFHWGYFIMAAATVAQYDPDWAADYEGIIELLARDAANWDRSDTRFPYLRTFDPYAGHNWASGHSVFGGGNNQESSSEAMNFATALILWGSMIGNDEMRDVGIYMYTTEQQAIEQYWFDVDEEVFPDDYAFETVGILWGYGLAYATWWTANPEEIHGINMLPLTGGSFYHGHRPDYIDRNLAQLYAAPGAQGFWQDILWEYEAMSDASSAIARWNAQPNYVADGGQEGGETTAHTYHWLHSFNALGQVDTSVTANAPTYAVFVDPDSGDRTCVAFNPTDSPQTILFSNGAQLSNLAARTLGSTAVGECDSTPASVSLSQTGTASDASNLSILLVIVFGVLMIVSVGIFGRKNNQTHSSLN